MATTVGNVAALGIAERRLIVNKYELRWEDAAKRVQGGDGWACVKCGQWYGDNGGAERAARYCCSTDAPCECGKRREKTYTVCKSCREKKDAAKYWAMPEVEWDGVTPLVDHNGDRYLWDSDDVATYLAECEFDYLSTMDNPGANADHEPTDEQWMAMALDHVHLCLCRRLPPPSFDLAELLYDYDEEAELDEAGKAAEKAVNAWLEQYRPMWTEDQKRPSAQSIKTILGLE
jgi:hypothetical protein